MLKNVNLQLLAEPAAGDPGSGGTPPAATPPAASSTPPASVTFTADQLAEIDRITTERTTRASQAALKSYFQQQGMTEDQAAEAIRTYKDTKAKELPPSAAEAIAAEKKRADDAIAAANMTLIKASAQVMAATPDIGVRADRIETVLNMAKLGDIKVTDNVVDQAAVKAALEAVVKQFPEWKATSQPNQPGFQVGGNGGTPPAADDAALRKAFGLPIKT